MTIARYDVNSANVNRHVRFRVQSEDAGDRDAGIFLPLKGRANVYPFYGQIVSPTGLQEVAQLRLSLVVRALSVYTVPVSIQLADDDGPTGVGSALDITYEVDEFGAFFNDDGVAGGGARWPEDTSIDKHQVGDITDALGTGGMTTPKTKDGLTTLLDNLATVSFDGGTTGPFGALSGSGVVVLPDGTSVAGNPTLAAGGSPSGLAVTWINVG